MDKNRQTVKNLKNLLLRPFSKKNIPAIAKLLTKKRRPVIRDGVYIQKIYLEMKFLPGYSHLPGLPDLDNRFDNFISINSSATETFRQAVVQS